MGGGIGDLVVGAQLRGDNEEVVVGENDDDYRLPKPGTLDHSVTIALIKANQYLNSLFKSPSSNINNNNNKKDDSLLSSASNALGLSDQLFNLKINIGQIVYLANNYIGGGQDGRSDGRQ